jgi:hypothetical protein
MKYPHVVWTAWAAVAIGSAVGCTTLLGGFDVGASVDDGGANDGQLYEAAPSPMDGTAPGADGSDELTPPIEAAYDRSTNPPLDGAIDGNVAPAPDAAREGSVVPPPDATSDGRVETDGGVGDSSTLDAAITRCDAGSVSLRVFVTGQQFLASQVGSLVHADQLCQAAARAAGLCGRFVSWLSDDQSNALSRIAPTTAPFVLVDGVTVVAKGTAGLTSNALLHAIDLTEMNRPAPASPTACADGRLAVWTGTEFTGVGQPGYNCHNWTSSLASADGVVGFAQGKDGTWTYGCSGQICGGSASLYCIEQ